MFRSRSPIDGVGLDSGALLGTVVMTAVTEAAQARGITRSHMALIDAATAIDAGEP